MLQGTYIYYASDVFRGPPALCRIYHGWVYDSIYLCVIVKILLLGCVEIDNKGKYTLVLTSMLIRTRQYYSLKLGNDEARISFDYKFLVCV